MSRSRETISVHQRYPDYLTDQRQFFDDLVTEEWENYHSTDWDATRRFEVQQIFARFKPTAILDIGCGVGFHDAEMATYPFVEQVDAFDYSARSIERANQSYPHHKVNRFVADLATFQPSRQYDMVASFQVFEHLDKPDLYFEFCKQACRPGGIIAIVTPNRTRLTNRLRGFRGLPYELLDPQHFREYTIDEIQKLASPFGFLPAGGFGYGLWGWSPIMRFSHIRRLKLGQWAPWLAHGIAAFLARIR